MNKVTVMEKGGIAAVIISHDTECDTGYVKVENDCKQTCALSPCKEMIQKVSIWGRMTLRFGDPSKQITL